MEGTGKLSLPLTPVSLYCWYNLTFLCLKEQRAYMEGTGKLSLPLTPVSLYCWYYLTFLYLQEQRVHMV